MVQALGGLLLAPVFLYLFRASVARGAGMPHWFVYLVLIGPILYALSALLGTFDRIDLADEFASGEVIRGQAGDDRADDLVSEDPNVVVFGLSFAGSIAVAFLYVMLPLRARRVGLLSPFMGILGVIAGALLVLQLVPLVPVDRPGLLARRRGRALPRQLARRARAGMGDRRGRALADARAAPRARANAGARGGGDGESLLDPSEPGEPEAVPERPSSRKRKKRR